VDNKLDFLCFISFVNLGEGTPKDDFHSEQLVISGLTSEKKSSSTLKSGQKCSAIGYR